MKKLFTLFALLTATTAMAAPNENAAAAALAHFKANGKAYGLKDVDRELKARNTVVDSNGKSHVRFDQFFNDVKVFEGEAIAHVDRGGKVEVTNALRGNLDLDTTPSLSEATAISKAVGRMNAVGGFDIESSTLEVLPGGGRVADNHLVWHVRIFVENDASAPAQRDMFIDAHTGEVVYEFDSLETGKGGGKPGGGSGGGSTVSGVTGSGDTMYSGVVALSLNNPGSGTYTMQDTTRGIGTGNTPALGNYTMDMAGSTRRGNLVTGSSTSFGDGSLNNTDAATAPADAHYGLQMTWDYYKTVHGRNGIDNSGSQTYSRVHYSRNYENAFWSDSCYCMTYGDGASTFYPLVSIDVAGHEMSHGVTSRSANLTYSGESGGLNEATSDIFGTAVEFYANSSEDQPDWLIGERVWRSNWSNGNFSSNPRALRYMNDPAADGRSPACWSSTLGSLDVHYSSGPANHMFYLLSVGGKSKCNGNTVPGITIQKAEKIWYRALTRYMTSSTNYAGARSAALNAAADLYGSGSAEYAAVTAAFSAINVN